MNEFTKEELISLGLTFCAEYKRLYNKEPKIGSHPLIDKLQSLIDNYHDIDEFRKKNKESIHQICEVCGTWVDHDGDTHYINPCNDGGHEWVGAL
jgi:hypothetical protein